MPHNDLSDALLRLSVIALETTEEKDILRRQLIHLASVAETKYVPLEIEKLADLLHLSLRKAPKSSEQQYLKQRDVTEILGVNRTTIYRWIEHGHFPKPIALGPIESNNNSTVRWLRTELEAWLRTRPRKEGFDSC
ncbi:AlpA family phage regulatory protein [Alphaproteobacteria bacterium]|nr:AlpA family phage regulatory protein [Alphaproteobacteria bacterium]